MTRSRRAIWALPFLIAVALFSAGVWWLAFGAALDRLAERGRVDLALASDRLIGELFRYRELAVVLSDHPVLVGLLAGQGSRADAEAILREMADKTGALALELVDRDGRVVAASQSGRQAWDPHIVPVVRALNGALGADNEVQTDGAGHNRRLFSFAAPVFGTSGPSKGAVVAEVDIFLFEQNWPTTAAAVFFVDRDGRVIVTNRTELTLMRRFADEGFLEYRERDWSGHKVWSLNGGRYLPARGLHLTRDLPVIGLTAEILLDVAPAERAAALQASVAAALCLVFGAFLFVVSERLRLKAVANTRLEARVAKRTKALSEANRDLRREIGERKEAEAALKRAQADLVQAGKLSALGQMSAGISHELNQPLMAIGSFAENGGLLLERGETEAAARNLSRISALAVRAARIIKNLRAFARNESEPMGKVDLVQVIETAIDLTQDRLKADAITLQWVPPGGAVYAFGGEVRLVQVFVNLINNAADAMAGRDTPRLIRIAIDNGARLAVTVRDTGPGIADPERIFEPFYSTKEVGVDEGMGLGLSISYGLVQSFGGDIRGRNAEQGAEFIVELARWREAEAAA